MSDRRLLPFPRLTGLDGLRAVAVALVVVYHLFPQSPLRGGFVGVDVFFVISGFLITSLLLDERAQSGRIRLGAFWRRRARRLLPALALMVTVCATGAWLVGGDVLVKTGAQILGAATFSYNWISIADGAGYFSAGTPELFRNLWSLAVEEQFYVLWPLLLPLLLLLRGAAARTAVALLAAAASAGWMAALVADGADPTRAYFGTDSHAFGLLIGVALAFGLRRILRRFAARTRGPVSKSVGLVVGVVALAGVGWTALAPVGDDAFTFPGALVAASLLTAVAISAAVWPGSWFGRALDLAPLRWLGERSYGVYLWHWPLLVLVLTSTQGAGPDAGVPVWVGVGVLMLTLVAAELSYRFVERPVRRHGFRGSIAVLGRQLAGTPSARFGSLAAIAAWILVLGGTSAAIAADRPLSSAQDVVAAGEAALEAAGESSGDSTEDEPERPTVGPPVAWSAPDPAPTAATAVSGRRITAVGDSVMLASAPALLERFPGISVNAKVSRSMWAAPGILSSLADRHALRPYVVVALGTNGPVDHGVLEDVFRIVGPDRHLILVNAFAPRGWIKGVNRDLKAFAKQHPGVVVADWSTAIEDKVDLLAGDRIHPGMSGGRVFADAVSDAIQTVQDRIAQQARDRHDLVTQLRARLLAAAS